MIESSSPSMARIFFFYELLSSVFRTGFDANGIKYQYIICFYVCMYYVCVYTCVCVFVFVFVCVSVSVYVYLYMYNI